MGHQRVSVSCALALAVGTSRRAARQPVRCQNRLIKRVGGGRGLSPFRIRGRRYLLAVMSPPWAQWMPDAPAAPAGSPAEAVVRARAVGAGQQDVIFHVQQPRGRVSAEFQRIAKVDEMPAVVAQLRGIDGAAHGRTVPGGEVGHAWRVKLAAPPRSSTAQFLKGGVQYVPDGWSAPCTMRDRFRGPVRLGRHRDGLSRSKNSRIRCFPERSRRHSVPKTPDWRPMRAEAIPIRCDSPLPVRGQKRDARPRHQQAGGGFEAFGGGHQNRFEGGAAERILSPFPGSTGPGVA